uniref:Beta'-coat protein n=1 Tax=Mesocestoides corti TaxID=53468 RepID=A0A5K3FPG1_MESCO
MPLRLDVRKKLSSRSDRVKAIDLHPTEPWVCASLYNGNVHVWNIESQQLIKTFEVCIVPVRAVRFVARKNWIVTGSDNMLLNIFNYNTLERVHQFEAHSDYIRSIVVHPTQPFILTSSDDMAIRLWDWEKNWTCAQVFEGHTHYVMQLVINPKDNNTFASASLDKTIKVWSLGSPQPNFTLEGHEKGVNCVDYHPSADKPYLASGSDDTTVRIWDYQTKLCVQVLEGHIQNVSSLAFHPELPVILTGSEDGTVRLWHSNTYRLESTLNYGLERVWTVACHKGSQQVGIGYDEGTIVISLGREDPAMSMDSSGKLVCARHAELVQANIRSVLANLNVAADSSAAENFEDGARLPVVYKDMGACEIYPQTLAHNANGRFVAVCGDGEYIVYTAMALRNRMFGQALEFAWSLSDPNMYAVLENNTTFKIFKNFKEMKSFTMDFGADQIFGGHLLGIRSVAGFTFYDWQTGNLLRRIDVHPKSVYWAESGHLVAICTKECFYILRYRPEFIAEAEANGTLNADPDGVEAAFELIQDGEVKEVVKTGCWFGDAFLFTNSTNRLLYYVGGELVTVAHLDQQMYLLGYLASENRVFLADRDLKVISYTLLLSVLEYETAVLRGDFTAADSILPSIPASYRTKIARFLEHQGFRQQAMRVTTDPDHKFDLAIQLGDVTTAHDLIKDDDDVEGNEAKWKQIADVALKECNFALAQECFAKTRDYPSFLVIASSRGDDKMVEQLAEETVKDGIDNLCFLSRFILGDLEGCYSLLVKSALYPEAALFARTYLPSKVPEAVEMWKKWLVTEHKSPKAAEALANPAEYANLFPGWKESLEAERWLVHDRQVRRNLPASVYPQQTPVWERDVAQEMLSSGGAAPDPRPPVDSILFGDSEYEEPAKPPADPVADLLKVSTQMQNQAPHKVAVEEAEEEGVEDEDDEEVSFHDLGESDPKPFKCKLPTPPPSSMEQAFDPFSQLADFETPPPVQHTTSGVLHAAPPPAPSMDDFDAELEQQLAAFNIGVESFGASGVAPSAPPPPTQKSGAVIDDDWGDEDDDFDK